MAATSVNYGSLLRSIVKKNGYTVEYSRPELVTGGLCPPPSRLFPGTLCYMITVTVNGNSYYGFGPTPRTAKHFAEFEVYNALHPLPVEEVERVRSFIPEIGESESEGEALSSMNVPDLSQGSDVSDTTVVGDSPTDNKIQPSFTYFPTTESKGIGTGGVHRDITKVETQTFSTCTSERVAIESVVGQEARSPAKTTRTDTERFCEIPQSFRLRKYSVPKVVDETIAVLEETDDGSKQSPGTFMFSGTKRRDVVETLLEEAKEKGVGVSFQVYTVGPPHARAVLAKAIGGGLQCEGYHRRRKVAKALAANKLLQQLQTKPSRKGGRHVLYPGNLERPASCIPSMHSAYQAGSHSGMRSPSDHVSDNPVGQLEELLMKELHNLPMYAEHVSGVGKYVEYECVVSGKGLSAKGVGSSKKLAKRHASENLLAIMSAEGMNINPSLVNLKTKKPLPHSRRHRVPNFPRSRCVTPMPISPSRFHGPLPPHYNPPPRPHYNLPPSPHCSSLPPPHYNPLPSHFNPPKGNPPPPPHCNPPPPPHCNPPPPPHCNPPPPPHCNPPPPPHCNPPPPPHCNPPPPPHCNPPPPPHCNPPHPPHCNPLPPPHYIPPPPHCTSPPSHCNPPPPPHYNPPLPPHCNPPPPPHCNLPLPPHCNPPPPPHYNPPPPPHYNPPPPAYCNPQPLNCNPPCPFSGPPRSIHPLPYPTPPVRPYPHGLPPSPYPLSPLPQWPTDPCPLPPSLHLSPMQHRISLNSQQSSTPPSQLSPEELSSSPNYESESDSDLESSSQVVSQGLSEIVPPEARPTSLQVQHDSCSSHPSTLVDSISQLAVSLNDYVDRNFHTPTCSGGRGVLSANNLGVSAQPSHQGSSQKSLAQGSSCETSQESTTGSKKWCSKAKPQPPVNTRLNSSTMWKPKQLSPKLLLPEHTMHYSDPLNFTMRLPREGTELWSSPPNLRKEVLKQKPLHPPWVTKRQHVNTAVPQKTLQVNLGSCDVDDASSSSESTWAGVSDASPELPPHPLLYRLDLESSRTRIGGTAVNKSQSEKPSNSVRDSVNVSPSDIHVHNSKKLIRVVGDIIIEGGIDASASDFEDSLHCGLAGPGLPTQGSLEAMHYVLK